MINKRNRKIRILKTYRCRFFFVCLKTGVSRTPLIGARVSYFYLRLVNYDKNGYSYYTSKPYIGNSTIQLHACIFQIVAVNNCRAIDRSQNARKIMLLQSRRVSSTLSSDYKIIVFPTTISVS
jgi:hypothetical protein